MECREGSKIFSRSELVSEASCEDVRICTGTASDEDRPAPKLLLHRSCFAAEKMNPFLILDRRGEFPEAELHRNPTRLLRELEKVAGGREEQTALGSISGIRVTPRELLKVCSREELVAETLSLSPKRCIALRTERWGVEALRAAALGANLIADELRASWEEASVKLGEGLVSDRCCEEDLDETSLLEFYLDARSPSTNAVPGTTELLSPSGLSSRALERLPLAFLKGPRELLLMKSKLPWREELPPFKLCTENKECLIPPQKMLPFDPEKEGNERLITVRRRANPEACHRAL